MKHSLMILSIVLLLTLFIFSLSSAQYSNYAAPQLEFISNGISGLWNRPKTDVFRMMDMFPDYICTDYEDQIGCVSQFNTDQNNNIFLNFFTDDYEEHHDNLWKFSVTADLGNSGEGQALFSLLWLAGMKPFHNEEDTFEYPGVVPLYFNNEQTTMVIWAKPYEEGNNPFLLAEYYNGHMR